MGNAKDTTSSKHQMIRRQNAKEKENLEQPGQDDASSKKEKFCQTFATRLRAAMANRDLRIKDLAAITNIARQSIGYYLTGTSIPDAEKLANIAKNLNVSTDYLLGLSDEDELKEKLSYENAIKLIQRLSDIKGVNCTIANGNGHDEVEGYHLSIEVFDQVLTDYFMKTKELEEAFGKLPLNVRMTTAQIRNQAVQELLGELKDKAPKLYSDDIPF